MRTAVAFTIIMMAMSLNGCVPKYYNPAYAEHEMQRQYDRDSLDCKLIARNLVQMPQGQMVVTQQPPQNTYGSFSGYDYKGNYYRGSYSEHQVPNRKRNFQDTMAMANNMQVISQQTEANNLRQQVFKHCMEDKGWRRE